ncbi:unnamed protein product [Cylicostephanus goldi]|uniref:Uncharacterized protein n=1 Tax=Cylicostephanus goldi TaxID=71465 RepID=A0A3P7MAW7_CYLGO|nr:unnamed protein product [Cylicostephanus goldi]
MHGVRQKNRPGCCLRANRTLCRNEINRNVCTCFRDDPDMEALAEMIESETGLSKKFSLISNTKTSTELVDAFKAFNTTEEVSKEMEDVFIGSDNYITEEIKEKGKSPYKRRVTLRADY